MGYMTIISILNDGWSRIKENPKEFIDKIETGMFTYRGKQVSHFSIGTFSSPLAVVKSKHADVPQLVYCQHNSTTDISAVSENKDSLSQLKYHKEVLNNSKQLIEAAEERIYDIIGTRVLKMIQENEENITDLSIDEIYQYIKNDEWAKELKICNKTFAKYLKKNYKYIRVVC